MLQKSDQIRLYLLATVFVNLLYVLESTLSRKNRHKNRYDNKFIPNWKIDNIIRILRRCRKILWCSKLTILLEQCDVFQGFFCWCATCFIRNQTHIPFKILIAFHVFWKAIVKIFWISYHFFVGFIFYMILSALSLLTNEGCE